ncbi:LAME_0E08174g1_1 [Lachancea meyersii CBS 8951]|uniref:LAME_0E08174g1_1 n=1 Tax=Lachancea meyersii CBS 8951 TaxID=1266667 RepID=A0A1G4JJ64_9SACH|nr:LAME_0E08174g1_1 [Lachancea meyersii CBS 8951]
MTKQAAPPTVVGSLACQRDSFLSKSFPTTVLKCTAVTAKNNEQYEIEFQDTILFPEGGGQPGDSGFIIVNGHLAEAQKIAVSQVVRKGLYAVHYVDQPVEPGTQVLLEVDWKRRMDHMQQHTGQHLVSAILEREWTLKTLSWSMGGVSSTNRKTAPEPSALFNQIEIGRKLSAQELARLSDLCNEYTTVKAQEISVVRQSSDDAEIDAEKGAMRTVHIGQLDANPCCGTHLQNTAQIGPILFSPFQSSVRGSNFRIQFMCGARVLRYANFTHELAGRSKALLSCTEAEIPEKIEQQRSTLQKATKKEQYLTKKMAEFATSSLVDALNAEPPNKAHLCLDEFGNVAMLTEIQKQLLSQIENNKIEHYKIVLCARDKATNSGAVMILADSGDDLSVIASDLTKIAQKLKGGGGKKGGKWQGKVTEFGNLEWESLTNYLDENF